MLGRAGEGLMWGLHRGGEKKMGKAGVRWGRRGMTGCYRVLGKRGLTWNSYCWGDVGWLMRVGMG